MKKSTVRLASVVLCGCILAGCSSSEESTAKKKKSKKSTTQEETEIDTSSEETPSESSSKEPKTSLTSEETTTEESSTPVSSEESSEQSTADSQIVSEWHFDDSYLINALTPEGKKSFGAVPLCPGFEFSYNLQFKSVLSNTFTPKENWMDLEEYYDILYILEDAGERIDAYTLMPYVSNDPNSPFKTFDIMIFEEIPFDPPTETYVIIELNEDVGETVYTREFQEMLYPYIEALFGTDLANIMMYTSDEALGYMRCILPVDGYARAPEYRIQRLVNHHHLEFFIQESTSISKENEHNWDDYTPPTS